MAISGPKIWGARNFHIVGRGYWARSGEVIFGPGGGPRPFLGNISSILFAEMTVERGDSWRGPQTCHNCCCDSSGLAANGCRLANQDDLADVLPRGNWRTSKEIARWGARNPVSFAPCNGGLSARSLSRKATRYTPSNVLSAEAK